MYAYCQDTLTRGMGIILYIDAVIQHCTTLSTVTTIRGDDGDFL